MPLTAALYPLPPCNAALVDLDGTLVDTLGDFVHALRLMLLELPSPWCDFQLRADTVERLVGKGSEHLVQSLLTAIDPRPLPLAPALARYQHHYAGVNGQHARVYPGALAGLQVLQARGWRLACVTNKPTVFAQALLQTLGLSGYFAFVQGDDALAEKKPQPEPLWLACSRLGSLPAHTLMVGDSSNDAQAARAAGCPVLLVTYGYNHGSDIRAVDADAWCDSLAQLADLV